MMMGGKDIEGKSNQHVLDEHDKKLKEYMDATSESVDTKRKSEPIEYYGIDEDNGPFLVVMMFGIFVAVAVLGILYLIVKKELGV